VKDYGEIIAKEAQDRDIKGDESCCRVPGDDGVACNDSRSHLSTVDPAYTLSNEDESVNVVDQKITRKKRNITIFRERGTKTNAVAL